MYLDANATTRLSDEAFQAMLPWLREEYGNPSSVHDAGKRARRALEEARSQVAAAMECHADEVFFFSSATEATNAVIQSAVAAARARAGSARPQAATSPAEHECVLKPLQWRAERGEIDLTLIPVTADGRLQIDRLQAWLAAEQAVGALPGRVALCSFMLANNETGVVDDLAPVAAACRAQRIPLHIDAVQALGKIPVQFAALQADYLTLAPHKIGGPKGIGILIARRVAPLDSWVRGGPQEQGIRGGTENVAAIVGAGVAVQQAVALQAARQAAWTPLRDELERRILAAIPGAVAWGCGAPRVANTTFISVPGIEAEAALMRLSQLGIHAASGAACSSSEPEPSHVLLAMGATREQAHGAIRLSLPPTDAGGPQPQDIPTAADTIIAALRQLQGESKPAGGGTRAESHEDRTG